MAQHTQPEALAALPTELVTAALGHCDPLALLQLARTSKAWRGRLLTRTAEPIWLSAFGEAFALGCPGIPAAVDTPTYASLLFEDTCTSCGESTRHPVLWLLLVRLCDGCRHELWTFPDFLRERPPADARVPHLMLRMPADVDGTVYALFRTADTSQSTSVVWIGDAQRVFRRLLGGQTDHSATGLAVLGVQSANVRRMKDDLDLCHDEIATEFLPAWRGRPSRRHEQHLFVSAVARRLALEGRTGLTLQAVQDMIATREYTAAPVTDALWSTLSERFHGRLDRDAALEKQRRAESQLVARYELLQEKWSNALAELPSAWLHAGSVPPVSYALLDEALDPFIPLVLTACSSATTAKVERLFLLHASKIVQDFRTDLETRVADAGTSTVLRDPLDVFAYVLCGHCDGDVVGWVGSQRLFDHVCFARPRVAPKSHRDFWSTLYRPPPSDCEPIDTIIGTIVASTGADRRALTLLVDEGALKLRLLPSDSRAAQRLPAEARDRLQTYPHLCGDDGFSLSSMLQALSVDLPRLASLVRVVPFEHGRMAADLAPYLEPDAESTIEVHICPCEGFSAVHESNVIEHRLRSCASQVSPTSDPGFVARLHGSSDLLSDRRPPRLREQRRARLIALPDDLE